MKRTLGSLLAAAVFAAGSLNASAAEAGAKKDIVDTAVGAGTFTTLAAALKAAGLVEALKGPGPFTVFAPTDDAFKKLPAGTVEDLLKPENVEKLKGILTYHVVSGRMDEGAIAKASEAKTLQGGTVAFKVSGDKLMVGPAAVVTADVEATNGVIHVIDTVLIPAK